MPRRPGGLGDYGRRRVDDLLSPFLSVDPVEPEGNPAALTISIPDEREFVPDYWDTFDSSRVREAVYDREHQRLYVRFVKPEPVGTPWTYEGVPENVWRNFKASKSQGKFVNRVLNQYSYHQGTWNSR
jgi:hypothetical protein